MHATLAAEMVKLSPHAKAVLPKHSVLHFPAHDFTGLKILHVIHKAETRP